MDSATALRLRRMTGKGINHRFLRDHLLAQGTKESRIIAINFEDIEYECLNEYRALHAFVSERLDPKGMNYVLLDEIQHVQDFEKAVDSLHCRFGLT
jgi:predicted AAA+ superfamily ATPase